MEMGETLYEWEERAFFEDTGLASFWLAVSAEGPHTHSIFGDRPACVAMSLEITSGNGTVQLLGEARSPADRDAALAPFVALRDALNAMIDQVDEAIGHAAPHWQTSTGSSDAI
ncbi:MAG: hypothetical protein ACF8QF_04205 [Phycisphaerales bacterium]